MQKVCNFAFFFNSHIIIFAFATHHEVFAGCNEPTLFSFQKIFPMGDIIRKMDLSHLKKAERDICSEFAMFCWQQERDKRNLGRVADSLTRVWTFHSQSNCKLTFDPFWTQHLEQIEVSGLHCLSKWKYDGHHCHTDGNLANYLLKRFWQLGDLDDHTDYQRGKLVFLHHYLTRMMMKIVN